MPRTALERNRPENDLDHIIQQASKRVRTEALSQKGVGSLRILSESRFQEVVQELVERTVGEQLESVERRVRAEHTAESDKAVVLGVGPAPVEVTRDDDAGRATEDEPAEAVRAAYQSNWDRLRAQQSEQLETLEARLSGLSAALTGVREAFRRFEERRQHAASDKAPRKLRRKLEQRCL